MKRGTKTALVWLTLVGVIFLAVLVRNLDERPEVTIAEDMALGMIDSDMVSSYRRDPQGLILVSENGHKFRLHEQPGGPVSKRLAEYGVSRTSAAQSSSFESLFVWLLVPLLLILVIIYFLRKAGGGQMGNLFELRKSKARPVQDSDKARFSDIGGNEEAVELLADIVDFLKAPDRWTSAGARIPRGVLVVGPPGTGKTLLARAVAGETNSAFFYTSAAEFVEMFVGIGAARVRDTFEKAGAQQPAVIFIDELDAIGRRRGSGAGTIHEEREQTLNQLLVSMDGLEHRARLVVIAATNRPDVLDPALLRSGRFDRLLRLNPPKLDERTDILKIHTRNKKLDQSVSLERLAQQTEGFTGADLEVLANEASLRAIRRSRQQTGDRQASVTLSDEDFELARESMVKSNRQFDRLDTVLVESVSQFSEPAGRAVVRVTLTTGTTVEGDVVWMSPTHIKLQLADGTAVVIGKETAVQFVPLSGTESTPQSDFQPDRWSGKSLDVG